jgi:hypothetical protein
MEARQTAKFSNFVARLLCRSMVAAHDERLAINSNERINVTFRVALLQLQEAAS